MRKTRKEIRQRRGKTWGEKKKDFHPVTDPPQIGTAGIRRAGGKGIFFYFPSSPSLVLIHPHLACKKRREEEEVDWRGREKEEEEASIKVKMGGREKGGGGGKRISRVSPI